MEKNQFIVYFQRYCWCRNPAIVFDKHILNMPPLHLFYPGKRKNHFTFLKKKQHWTDISKTKKCNVADLLLRKFGIFRKSGMADILVYNLNFCVNKLFEKNFCLLRILHSELLSIWQYHQDYPKGLLASLGSFGRGWAYVNTQSKHEDINIHD